MQCTKVDWIAVTCWSLALGLSVFSWIFLAYQAYVYANPCD